MKITCNVIKDLIPSYIDEICSDDSKKVVESHMKECEKCRKYAEDMTKEIEYPEILDKGEAKDPFRKIRRKNQIHLALAIIITSCVIVGSMFAVQEVGMIHDYFYPAYFATIEKTENNMAWQKVQVSEDGYLNFSSLFYDKEVINVANSDGEVVLRVLDKNNDIIFEETTIEPGKSVSLKMLKNNQDYIVEVKCSRGRFFLNFV